MLWLVDESKKFLFQKIPPMRWEIANVTGAILSHEGRRLWLKKNKNLKKGSEYYREFFKTKREGAICRLLDDMIECRVKGILYAGDIGHVSEEDAEKFRHDWVFPHYAFADSEPTERRESLRHHLDNLMGKKKPVLSLQDFFKVLGILEIISSFFVLHLKDLKDHTAFDLQKLKLIIDDQSKASLTSLKNFVSYFIFCRAQDGLYRVPPDSIHLLGKSVRKIKDQTVFDANKILSKTLVEEKANMDDKHPELKIADLLSNFTGHALNGHFSMKVVQKLDKIFNVVHDVCFDPQKEVTANIPPLAQEAVNLLFRKDRK